MWDTAVVMTSERFVVTGIAISSKSGPALMRVTWGEGFKGGQIPLQYCFVLRMVFFFAAELKRGK